MGERAERGETGDWAGVGTLQRALTQRVCGFMEHECGQALNVHVHGEGMVGERSAAPAEFCKAVAGGSL